MSSQLLAAVAPYAVPVLLAILTPLVTYAVNQVLAHLPANKRALAEASVQTGVAAAEQMAANALSGPGKKQQALELIEHELAALHINVPAPVLNAMIESAVYSLNQQQQSNPAQAPAQPQADPQADLQPPYAPPAPAV